MRRSIPVLVPAVVFMAFLPAAPVLAADDDIPGAPLAVGRSISQPPLPTRRPSWIS